MTINYEENDLNGKTSRTKQVNRRGILTNSERIYLTNKGKRSAYYEYVIGVKLRKALEEDIPLIASRRPLLLNVRRFNMEYEFLPIDEPIAILEKRCLEGIKTLYWLYGNRLAAERMAKKSKQKVAKKEVMKCINKVIKQAKTEINQIDGVKQNVRKQSPDNYKNVLF
jgi:hypothetical protein